MASRPFAAALTSITLLAAWLGASLLVAAVVAPAAFEVLPSRTLAGALVGRVLPVLFWSGALIGLAMAALASGVSGRGWRIAAGLGIALPCAIAQLVVAPRIERIRAAVSGPMDALAVDDPRRLAFGKLHGASVGLLGLAMIAAAVAVVLCFRTVLARSTT